jgi:hypothetical protein
VLTLAHQARKWAEHQAIQEDFPPSLVGFCAKASAYLFTLLKAAGYDPQIIENDSHCFVLVDQELVDITATQFSASLQHDFQPVEIRPLSDLDSLYFWDVHYRHYSVTELQTSQTNRHWPSRQIPA